MSSLKEDGKYLASRTSILSKSMNATFDFEFFLDFVSFKASTIVNPIDEGEGCNGGCWEGVIWRTNLPYIGLHGDLATCIGSCERVESTLINGNGKMCEISTNAKISSSEYDNTNTLSSMGSNSTCATGRIWTMGVPYSFVNMTLEVYIRDSKKPITLNERGPNLSSIFLNQNRFIYLNIRRVHLLALNTWF